MTYHISWLEPGRIIDIVMPENCGDDFLLSFDAELDSMLSTAQPPVHVLMDARDVTSYPTVQIATSLKCYKNPSLGYFIVVGVGTNPFLRFLVTLVSMTAGVSMKTFATPGEAHAFLSTH